MADKNWWETEYNSKANPGNWWENDYNSVSSTVSKKITDSVNSWLQNHNNYVSNYQQRTKGRKYTYEDSYVRDSTSWLATVSQQKKAFDASADSILAYMDRYKGYLDADWVKSVQDTLASARGQQTIIYENSAKDNQWWRNFANEDEYKTAQRYDGYNQKYSGQKYEDIQKALSMLEDGSEEKWWLDQSKYELYKRDSNYTSKAMSGLKSYEAQKIAEQEKESNKTWWDKFVDFGIDNFGPQNGDPMTMAIENAREFYAEDTSWREMNDNWSEGEKRQFGYLYAEDPNKAYKFAEQVNNYYNAKAKYDQQQAIGATASKDGWSMVGHTAGAIATAPMGIADFMDDLIEYSARGTITQKNMVTPFEYGQAAQSGIADKLNTKYGTIDGDKFIFGGKGWGDVYSLGVSAANSLVSAYTLGGTGTLVNFIGQGGAAGVDDALSRGATPEQALLYGSIVGAAEGVTEMINADNLLKVGSSATLKNYLLKALNQGIGESIEEGASSIIGNIADNIIMQDKSNFYATVQQLMEDNPGMSEEEAKNKAWINMVGGIAFDAMGGFATGIGNAMTVGAASTAWDARKGNQKNIDAVKQYGEFTGDLIQEGLQSDKKSESYKLAQKYQKQTQGTEKKAGKAMTGFQIRNLLAANQAEVTKADLQNIQSTAEKRLVTLGQKEDVSKIAELATKYATGGELTRSEKRFLTGNKYGSQVTSELLNSLQGIGSDSLLSEWENNMSEGWGDNYSTEWAEGIETKAVRNVAQTKKMVRAFLDAAANMPVEDPAAYKSLTERAGTEGRFGVSESGQATIRATGKAFDFDNAEVAEVGNGQLSFKREDGGKVSAGGIDFVDDNQSFLVSAVSDIENITPAAATEVMHKIVDMSKPLGEQLNGIDEAFTYGYNNYSVEDMKAGNFAKNLSEEQMMRAYELGQEARKDNKVSNTESIKKMRTAVQAMAEKAAAEGKETPKAKKLAITYNHGGGVIEDIETAGKKLGKLNKEQRGGIEAAKILHQMGIGTDFELFTSYYSKTLKDKEGKPLEVFLNDEGQEQAAYAGVYMAANGKIRINLNAYSGTKGLTLNALSHELTHFIKTWSLEKYEAMADFLVKSYGEHGVSMHQLVLKEQSRLEGIREKEVSYSEAYDEVVANAFNRMLEDGKVMERIAEIRQVDKSLADRIIAGIRKFIKRFMKVYQDNQSLFMETEALMEMKEVFEELQEMFAEALVDASDNFQANLMAPEVGVEPVAVKDVSQFSYSSLAEAAGFVAVQNDDGTRSFVRDGQAVSEVTIADIENSPIGAFINFSVEMKDISEADAKRQKEMFAKICTMACKTNDFAMTMQFVGSAVFTGMKANADKQYGTTYDFPSICTKTQAVIDAMSAKMMSLGRGLNTDEIVKLYDDVFASGNPVPCPECYVFSRWIGIGGLLDNIKKYQDYYGNMAVEDVAAAYLKMKAEVSKFAEEQGISFGKAKGALTSKLTKEYNKLTEKIEKAQNQGEKVKPADQKRLAELEPMMNTVKGMTWLENVYFADSSLKKVNPRFRVPNEVLFDLNNGEAFATQYKEAWAFRTTQGAGYGKAITPYAEARLGEGVLVTNNTTNAIKGRAQGTLNNYFLNQKGKLDKQSRDALKRARMKQKIQAFIGGQRFQSTSDARYENASDYLLAALEMQAMGGMVQCYTKVDGAVPAFAAWGFSINQSLMPLNGGLDADGNVKDTAVGGMKPSVAFDNRDKHETAGTITIGVNDNHIREMFKQWVRDFIIPYHASGGKATVVAEFRRIQEGKEAKGEAVRSTDYSRTQSDKILSDEVLRWQGKTDAQIQRIHEIRNARIAILTGGKPNMTVVRSNRFLSALYDKLAKGGEWEGVQLAKSKVESQIFPNEFWDQTVSYEESGKITRDYLEYCEDLGFLHRFSGTVPSNGRLVAVNGYNEKGERVQLTDLAYKYDENGNKTSEVEPFFWKVLTDRRMYDNSGKYLPQKVVTLNETTADTVTGFAKHNQGRQYDKAKAEALANKILNGEQYSSQQTDANGFADYVVTPAVYTIRNEKAKRGHDLVRIGNMPTLYRDLFGLSGDVYVSNEHLYQNMVSRETAEAEGRFNPEASADYHDLGEVKVINAIEQFQDPLVIMESLKDFNEPRLVAILDEKGNDGQNLLAVMELYAPIAYPGKNQRRNHVLITIYEKNSLPDYIEKTVDKGRILHKKEGLPQTRQAGLQLAGAVSKETLKKNVALFNKKVKAFKEKNNIQYSTQQTDNITNRHLLANAFEGIVQNSDEYKMIQEYRENIKALNELDNRLSDVNQKIRKIRFGGEGQYDAEKLQKLHGEASKLAEAINKQDKKLLQMEASEPLRKVIDRERKKEAQKTKDHVKEIQQNKKVRAEQAELRHKIRKAVRDLDKALNRGNKKQNVKQDMRGFVSKALDLADYIFTDHISNDELIRRGIDADLIRGNREAQLVHETEEILKKLYDEADSLTDEEFTRLDAKRKANEDKLRDLLTAQRNKRLSTPVYKLFDDLVNEYAKLANSKQDAVKAAYNVDLLETLRSFMGDDEQKAALQNMRVADMTTKELEALLKAYKMVLVNVRDADKIHARVSAMTIGQMADRITKDFGSRKIPDKELAIAVQKIANKIGWSYEKLYYALDRIGSEAFTELFMTLADSENIVMQDVMEAEAFRDGVIKEFGYNNWAVNKEIDREFLDNTGKKFKLTLGQLMALYAYSRREGAWDHLEYGGFVFGKAALTNPRPADSYKLNKEQCEAITSLLTKEQKAYAEKMQKYLSETMGAKGNEVSMKLHGIEMFGEENYFPIHVAGQFKAQAQESQAKAAAGFQTMSNAGFTHAQNRNAKAPIVLEGFMEVWTDHVNEMSRYHGTVPALEDIRRVMNRSTYSDSASESTSIKQQMINAYGEEAAQYFDNLYREANSGAITDKLQATPKKLLSLFRKNSVAYSLSVWIQQTASLVRAYAMIDRKYFGVAPIAAGVTKAVTSKWNTAYADAYNEMLKYAPGVTIAKEIGGFDTATGGSIGSHLMDTGKSMKQKWQTGTALEKGKAVMDLVDDNAIANLPNVADKIAWIEIWNACKRETVAKHKDLKPGSEEFMQAVGKRFTEVIRATQVYDSIFAKSPMLKSKNLAVQYLVNFANEPNTVANMVEKAARDVARGDWKQGVKTAVVLVNSIVFTNMLKSLVYAMRDDDEDKNYIEKYIEAVVGNLMSDFNPLSYLPIGRDVLSLAQGYDVERPDMAILADVIDAYRKRTDLNDVDTEDMTEEKLIELEKKVTEANWKLAESVASFFGIPVKNIRRDVMGIINTVTADAPKSTSMSIRDTVNEALGGGKTKQDKLYAAIVDGDKEYLGRIKATYKTDDAYHTAVRKALRENDPRVKEAAQAHINGDPSERVRIAKQIIADGFDLNDVILAINAEIDKLTPDKESSGTEKVKGYYKVEDFVREAANGDTASLGAIREDILQTAQANGKTESEAQKDFVSDIKSEAKDAYFAGTLGDAKAAEILARYADLDDEEADDKVNYWAFVKAHQEYKDILNESNVKKYLDFAEPAEIPLDVYVQYVNGTKGLETIHDEWGEEVQSVRDQVLEVIDSLPLTWKQKDALYLAHEYAESKIWDVPW